MSSAATPTAIEVSHLTKKFGERTAVADVSFNVARGEVFGFLGPNGAGKTTTVRILGTLIAPTAGSAVVAGIPVSPASAAEIRQRIAIMPEAPGLYRLLRGSAVRPRAPDHRDQGHLGIAQQRETCRSSRPGTHPDRVLGVLCGAGGTKR